MKPQPAAVGETCGDRIRGDDVTATGHGPKRTETISHSGRWREPSPLPRAPRRVACVEGFGHKVVIPSGGPVVAPRCTRCGSILCHRTTFDEHVCSEKAKPFIVLLNGRRIWVRACPDTTPATLEAPLGVHGGVRLRSEGHLLQSDCDLYELLEPGDVVTVKAARPKSRLHNKGGGGGPFSHVERLERLLGPPGRVRQVLEKHIRYLRLAPEKCVAVFDRASQLCRHAGLKAVRLFLASYALDHVPLHMQAEMLAVPIRAVVNARGAALAGLGALAADPRCAGSERDVCQCLLAVGWLGAETEKEALP